MAVTEFETDDERNERREREGVSRGYSTLIDNGDGSAYDTEAGEVVYPGWTPQNGPVRQWATHQGENPASPTSAPSSTSGGRTYTAEEADFLRRNPGDEPRMAQALSNYTGDRGSDSQGPGFNQATNQPVPGWVKPSAVQPTAVRPPAFFAAPQPVAQPQGASLSPQFQNAAPLFSDPATRLVEDYALDRMGQRLNPNPDSGTAMFEKYAKELIETLKQPIYSPEEEAVLKGRAIDSIEQERSATKARWMEELSRRGITPSSGIALDGLLRIDEHFSQARNVFEREFAADAIQQTRDQRIQVLGTAGQLAGAEEARLRDAGTYAAMPLELQNQSFQRNLQLVTAGGSPQSVAQSQLGVDQLRQNADQFGRNERFNYTQLAQQRELANVANEMSLRMFNRQSDQLDAQQRQQLSSGLLQYLGYVFG